MRKWVSICIGVCIFFLGVLLLWGYTLLNSPKALNPETLTLLDRNNTLLAQVPNEDGWYSPYTGSLDTPFTRALIKVEDKRYYEHMGVDILGKINALWQNIQAGGIIRGGSTLTEQYIKNTYYPTEQRGYLQKGKEAILATLLSLKENKDTTLRNYLDSLYFGNRIYGIDTAMRAYFGKSEMNTLTQDEIVTLLTLIKYPGVKDLENQDWQLYRMQIVKRLGWNLTEEKGWINFASPEREDIFPILTTRVRNELDLENHGIPNTLDDFLIEERSSGTLRLSIDIDLQNYTTNTLKSLLAPLTSKNVTNGAIYIYDPKNEKVLAYVGNRSENGGGGSIDMILRKRSVGSLLKPFLYLEALGKGAEIDTLILDSDRIYDTEENTKKYIPTNYSLRNYGPIRLREALGNSLNMAAVRLTETIGLDVFYRFLIENGIHLDHESTYYGYGLILGGAELTLENIAKSYRNLIYEKEATLKKDKKNLYLLNQILSNPLNREKSFGVNSILNTSIPLAVKTGTSTDFRDNWTLSYHPDAIIGVWVGNLDSSPMIQVSGITGAGPIWHDIVEYMIRRGLIKRYTDYPPGGIIERYECLDTRCLQKQKTYKKNDKERKSRILEKSYYSEDFFTPPTPGEIVKWNIIQ